MSITFRERIRTCPTSYLVLSGMHLDIKRVTEIGEALKDNVNPRLTTLRLDRNKLGVMGAGAIAAGLKYNKTLEYLDLGSTQIGSEGAMLICEALLHNSTLTKLCMHDCNIGDQGIIEIANFLRVNKTLNSLFLLNNPFTKAGADALTAALRENRTLKVLDVRQNPFGGPGDAQIQCSAAAVIYGKAASDVEPIVEKVDAAVRSPSKAAYSDFYSKPIIDDGDDERKKKDCLVQ